MSTPIVGRPEFFEVSPQPVPSGAIERCEGLVGRTVIEPEELDDFVYVWDRMNTIFKFYYQAWSLWSLAGAFSVAVLLLELKGRWALVYRVLLVLVLIISLVFPVLGLLTKTNNFQIPAFFQTLQARQAASDTQAKRDGAKVWTLDGSVLFSRQYPDDAAAARGVLGAPRAMRVFAGDGPFPVFFARRRTHRGYSRKPGMSGTVAGPGALLHRATHGAVPGWFSSLPQNAPMRTGPLPPGDA